MYEPKSTHSGHCHWDDQTIFSFSHFIEVDEDKPCFHWLAETEEPAGEKRNEMLWFPSWARHIVKPYDGEGVRAVVAGNVMITQMSATDEPIDK